MESLTTFAPYWALYLAFALVGYWCWNQLFFWLPAHSNWRRFLRVPGGGYFIYPGTGRRWFCTYCARHICVVAEFTGRATGAYRAGFIVAARGFLSGFVGAGDPAGDTSLAAAGIRH